ncbi:MAG: hypothetical protein KTR35_07625 [Gammaproteobacteria bacterium]|nr:hypothetical protein [Gammaproteobacteria bacterium]
MKTCLFPLLWLLVSTHSFGNEWTDVAPMESWAEFDRRVYLDGPVDVHLRTGYQNAVLFPEEIVLVSIAGMDVDPKVRATVIPGCPIEVDVDVLGFSPSSRFKTTRIIVLGVSSGKRYSLDVKSSPFGQRQPIELQ